MIGKKKLKNEKSVSQFRYRRAISSESHRSKDSTSALVNMPKNVCVRFFSAESCLSRSVAVEVLAIVHDDTYSSPLAIVSGNAVPRRMLLHASCSERVNERDDDEDDEEEITLSL